MYSSPQAVGPIANLEYFVVEYVDDYVKWNDVDKMHLDNNDELADELYNLIINELDFKYLRNVVAWRLGKLQVKYEKEMQQELMDNEIITYKSDHKLYNDINEKTKIDDVYKLPCKDRDLLVLILNAMNIKENEEQNIEIERIEENDFLVYVNGTKFFVELAIDNNDKFEYNVSLSELE